MPGSNWTAAPITPTETQWTDAAARHHHDRPLHHNRARRNHDAAIGTASAIRPSVETDATSTGSVCRAEAGNRACEQHRGKKILHICSLHWAANAAPDNISSRAIRYV